MCAEPYFCTVQPFFRIPVWIAKIDLEKYTQGKISFFFFFGTVHSRFLMHDLYADLSNSRNMNRCDTL